MDPAVHESHRLQHVLTHRNVAANEVVGGLVELESVVAIER
jgi:hypothetical protein